VLLAGYDLADEVILGQDLLEVEARISSQLRVQTQNIPSLMEHHP
jgi:hypothetical protein